MTHKPDCKFVGTDIYVYHNSDNSDDQSIKINEEGIIYNPAIYSGKISDIINIQFNFCPSCGIDLRD